MQTSLITHFFNEELLIEDWITHHLPYFDNGILINHHSTDRSVEILRSKIPPHWEIRDTRLKDFDAIAVDQEVMEIERELTGWKMALNITEYLFCHDFRNKLEGIPEGTMAMGSRPVVIIDNEPNLPIKTPLFRNRTWGFFNYGEGNPVLRYWRFVHRGLDGQYTPGRHDTHLPKDHDVELLHLHFMYSPWPLCKSRKLQIQTRIPESNKLQGFGVQHIVTSEELDVKWNEYKRLGTDLLADPIFKLNYDKFLD